MMKKLYKLLSVSLIVTCMVLSSACGGKKSEDKAEGLSGKTEQYVLEDAVTLEIPSDFEVEEDEYYGGIIVSKDKWEMSVRYEVIDEVFTIVDDWAYMVAEEIRVNSDRVTERTINGKSAIINNYGSTMIETTINIDDVHCVRLNLMSVENVDSDALLKIFNDAGIQHMINSVKEK